MARRATVVATKILLALAALLSATLPAACGKKADAPPASGDGQNASRDQVDPSTAFLEMADRHAAAILQVSPEFATALGVSEDLAGDGYNARLGDYGFESNQRAREFNDRFLQELKSFDRASLTGAAATTYDVLKYAYDLGARRNQFGFGGASVWGAGGSPY